MAEYSNLHVESDGPIATITIDRPQTLNALDARTIQMADVNYHIGDTLGRLERYGEGEPYFQAELGMFPGHVRALGVALPYALANTIFGGTAEYVALWFKNEGIERGFYIYVTDMIAISLIVYLRMRDTKAHSRILED